LTFVYIRDRISPMLLIYDKETNMSSYKTERFYKEEERLGFDGIEYKEVEISPTEVLSPGYGIDHYEEFKRLKKTFTQGDDPIKRKLWKIAQYWGAYMEREMARTPDHELTSKIVNGTENVLLRWEGGCDLGYAVVPHILGATWRYGEKFSKLNGYIDAKDMKFQRAVTSDNAYLLYKQFKKEKNITPELRAKYLADVLDGLPILQYLQKQLKKNDLSKIKIFGKKVEKIVPMLSFEKEEVKDKELPSVLNLSSKILTAKEESGQACGKNTKEADLTRKIISKIKQNTL